MPKGTGRGVTLEKVYEEVKAVRKILEDVSERIILTSLPEEKLRREERAEVEEAMKEAERGELIPLNELETKYGKSSYRIRGSRSQKSR